MIKLTKHSLIAQIIVNRSPSIDYAQIQLWDWPGVGLDLRFDNWESCFKSTLCAVSYNFYSIVYLNANKAAYTR